MHDWLSGPWFRQRSYGYGATPTTWQGWALMAVLGLDIAATTRASGAWRGVGFVLVPSALIFLSYRKTEGGWRWRNGPD